MKKQEFRFPSATGVCEIVANAYEPQDGSIDTVLVIHHGMAEHQARYLGFIQYLCQNGVAVYMHDMANHGLSNTDYDMTGWFGKKGGYKALVEDFRTVVQRAKQENPGKKLVVMGHSMGSFICRLYTAWYPDDGFDGAIYMGTGGPSPVAGVGKALSSLIGAFKGKGYKSKSMDKIAFGSYGKNLEGRTPYDWLTRDTQIVDQYIADPYCGFLFTVQGMNDLIRANMASNTAEWFQSVPKELPILLVSGAQDPVGEWSKGIETISEKLSATGHSRVTTRLYPDCRHELLNELNKDEVMADILSWLRSI